MYICECVVRHKGVSYHICLELWRGKRTHLSRIKGAYRPIAARTTELEGEQSLKEYVNSIEEQIKIPQPG